MQRRSRVTVTIPNTVLAVARHDVASGDAASLSAWVTDAAEAKARQESLIHVLDEFLEASGGPLSSQETTWAREQLRTQ